MRLIETYRNDGYRVVLLSSSLDCVVEAVAQRLNAEWRASELGFVDGRCTDKLVRDILHHKHRIIAERYATDNTLMLTDNRTDLAFAAAVSDFIAVRSRSDERARRFWQRHGITQTSAGHIFAPFIPLPSFLTPVFSRTRFLHRLP
ncbi:MAG: hypothetical protein CMQ05_13000 [Gammaproteobacteria bacterium]|nr:hypothetical protein [Gammaproteobacteria bacterium]RPG25274.1 MAG: hypothetical protein CBC10_009220 [Gammaproteobacteria bacterium TMED50]